ncbi:hypothetical protein RHGRI_012569 [Rhododendron griersonianum]|uniref:Uncharacterized protein n=1 Tax=Rhododendron griersonianum TaxID=479676 RepID=A0AAV6KSP2_9ERIC|nr:hypothetical protein RHGRI_012569 [Rhododendron griersonianum]
MSSSAFELAAGLGDEEAGVGYSGDICGGVGMSVPRLYVRKVALDGISKRCSARTCMHANESRAATTLYIDRLTPVDHEHGPGGGRWKSTYVDVAGDLFDVLLKLMHSFLFSNLENEETCYGVSMLGKIIGVFSCGGGPVSGFPHRVSILVECWGLGAEEDELICSMRGIGRMEIRTSETQVLKKLQLGLQSLVYVGEEDLGHVPNGGPNVGAGEAECGLSRDFLGGKRLEMEMACVSENAKFSMRKLEMEGFEV